MKNNNNSQQKTTNHNSSPLRRGRRGMSTREGQTYPLPHNAAPNASGLRQTKREFYNRENNKSQQTTTFHNTHPHAESIRDQQNTTNRNTRPAELRETATNQNNVPTLSRHCFAIARNDAITKP